MMSEAQVDRAEFVSEDYKRIIRNLIDEFSRQGDVVYDPLAAAGTHLFVAKELNREPVGVDIDPQYECEELGIQHGDSSDTNFPDEAFDFVITSINPYGKPTSEAEEAAANLDTLEEYMRMLDGVIGEMYRVLVRGSYAVNISSTNEEHTKRCHCLFNKHFDEFVGMKVIESDSILVEAEEPKKVVVMLYRKSKTPKNTNMNEDIRSIA